MARLRCLASKTKITLTRFVHKQFGSAAYQVLSLFCLDCSL
jgi:hypothetical protein